MALLIPEYNINRRTRPKAFRAVLVCMVGMMVDVWKSPGMSHAHAQQVSSKSSKAQRL